MYTMLTLERKRSDYHHGSLRTSAIAAARTLVEQNGISALGLRKVAAMIGVTPTAIYRHFNNLEDLRAELSKLIRSELGEALQKSLVRNPYKNTRKSALSRFECLAIAYIEFARKNPRLYEAAFLSCEDDFVEDYDEPAWKIMQATIYELKKHGLGVKDELEFAIQIWSTIHGFSSLISSGALSPRQYPEPRMFVLRGLLHTVKRDL